MEQDNSLSLSAQQNEPPSPLPEGWGRKQANNSRKKNHHMPFYDTIFYISKEREGKMLVRFRVPLTLHLPVPPSLP